MDERNRVEEVSAQKQRQGSQVKAAGGSKELNPEPAEDTEAGCALDGLTASRRQRRLLEHNADAKRGEPPAPCCDWLLDQDLIPDLLMVWEACMVRLDEKIIDRFRRS